MRILLPLAFIALSAQAMTTTATNAAREAPREIWGSYRFTGFFCGDVPMETDIGGTINLEINATNLIMTTTYSAYANDQFLLCTERTDSRIVSVEGNLLQVESGVSVVECLDNQGNTQREEVANQGLEAVRFTKNGKRLDLTPQGSSVPLCSSGAPFIAAYELTPIHE